jgi:flagellar protein FliS
MKKEDIDAFSRRIACANASEIIVILYEMFFTYESDGLEAMRRHDWDAYIDNMRQCSLVLEHLKNALDFKYNIANNLYALYNYAEVSISKAIYSRKEEYIDAADRVMKPLWEAFVEVAKSDDSDSVMQNSQRVTAGLTYGRNNLNESYDDGNLNRGFLV